jgi:hypothetical protein
MGDDGGLRWSGSPLQVYEISGGAYSQCLLETIGIRRPASDIGVMSDDILANIAAGVMAFPPGVRVPPYDLNNFIPKQLKGAGTPEK